MSSLAQSVTTEPNAKEAAAPETTSVTRDDWVRIDHASKAESSRLLVPSFIRLFVINRIICHCTDNNYQTEAQLRELINQSLIDDNDKAVARNVLFRLKEDGILKYMEEHYHEKQESVVIEIIFNKIILSKFETEYNKLMTFDSINYFENLVFNSSDIMSKILQCLEYSLSNDYR